MSTSTTSKPPAPAGASSGAPSGALKRSGNWARRAPLLPALILVIIVTQLPFLTTIFISFMNWNAYYPDRRGFAGIDNFRTVLSDPDARHAIFVTVVMTIAVVAIALVLGLVIALLLDRKFLGRGHRPHDDDHPVPHRPGRRRPAVEARALQPGVRPLQRDAAPDLR